MILLDSFQLGGHYYVVFICRYSNWINTYRSKEGTAKELLSKLSDFVGHFG